MYRLDCGGVAVGRVERSSDFTVPLGFYHNEYQIQYIHKGERYFFVDGVCYRMDAGTLAFIDKSLIAKTCILGGNYHDRLLVEIEEKTFREVCDGLGLELAAFFKEHHGVFQVKENAFVQEIISEIEKTALEACAGRAERNSEITAATDGKNEGDEIAAKIAESTAAQLPAGVESRLKIEVLRLLAGGPRWESDRVGNINALAARHSVEKQKRVHEVADYITENFTQIQSVEELADRFYMSKSYLCRIFREVTNFTISEYINLYRIAASKEYLVADKYSITQIANLLGYDSLTYFERVFKNQTSVSPLQFRKLYRTTPEKTADR